MFPISASSCAILILILCPARSAESEKFAEDAFEEEYGKIIHTSVMFRHGNRNPYAPYPFDPYKDFEWPEGLGHLTNAGKRRLYELGKWFRRRYADLLGDRYFHEDIKMESSDYDRTIMSAQCLLAGLYPPTQPEEWNEQGLNWQPIPVHTIPLKGDNLIALFKNCEIYNYELFATSTAPKFKELFRKNEEFFTHVSMSTGVIINENFVVFGLLKLMEIYDALNVQSENGFELPFWSNTVFPEPMRGLAIKLFELGTYTDKMKRLKTGPFFQSIITDMQKKVNEHFGQNLHFYSGHDATIATIMITLEIFDDILPPYGSALMFELREKDDQHFVTVVYRNDSSTPPFLVEIPACKSPCSLEDFVYLTKPFIPDDWDEECKVQPVIPEMPAMMIPSHESIFTTNQMMILGLVIVLILLTALYFSVRRKKPDYRPMKKREANKAMHQN